MKIWKTCNTFSVPRNTSGKFRQSLYIVPIKRLGEKFELPT